MWTYAAFTTAAARRRPGRVPAECLGAAGSRRGGRSKGAAGRWLRGLPGEQLLEPRHLAAAREPPQQAVALAHVDLAEAASRLRPVVRRRPGLRHPDHGGV